MTTTYNTYEAKAHFSELIDRAAKGESIIIAKAGVSQAMIVPLPKDGKSQRAFGLGKGKIWYSKDCWNPMEDDDLKDWYGDTLPPLDKGASKRKKAKNAPSA